MNSNVVNWALTGGATATTIAFVFAAIRWAGMPRLSQAITETINTTVGPSITKIPELTEAVNRLTTALTQQSADTDMLNTTILSLETKFDNMVADVGKLAQRTSALEGALPTIASTAQAAAKVVESAALAAESAGKAAAEAAATVLETAAALARVTVIAAHRKPNIKTPKKKARKR
jgi:hypothetical protein